MKKSLFAVFFLGLLLTTSYSQTVIGKYGGEFLSIGAGGRASAMGGANVAIVNDVTAGYWNPAGLARMNYPQISLMHEEHFGNLVNYNYGAVAIPYGSDMSFGLSVIRLSVDGIPDTRNALYDANGDGILDIHTDRLDYSKITELNIPTGVPLVYELDADLKPIKHYYLGDQEAINAAINAVAKQTEKK